MIPRTIFIAGSVLLAFSSHADETADAIIAQKTEKVYESPSGNYEKSIEIQKDNSGYEKEIKEKKTKNGVTTEKEIKVKKKKTDGAKTKKKKKVKEEKNLKNPSSKTYIPPSEK